MPADRSHFEALIAAIATLAMALVPQEAFPADTVEPVVHGTLDHEAYIAMEGLKAGGSGTLLAQYLTGVGVAPRFSFFLGGDAVVHPAVPGPEAGFLAGVIGTPLDTDHVDIDLGLEIGCAGAGPTGAIAGPLVEFNYDGEPDLSLWGLYLQAGLPLFWTGDSPAVDVELRLGAYLTLRDVHQILVETSAAFHPLSHDRTGRAEIGGISLGYNVTVHEAVEIILEILLDVPQGGEPVSAGLMVGAIVTLPGRSHM